MKLCALEAEGQLTDVDESPVVEDPLLGAPLGRLLLLLLGDLGGLAADLQQAVESQPPCTQAASPCARALWNPMQRARRHPPFRHVRGNRGPCLQAQHQPS